jgi:outer membrane protein assembly factor BamA
MFYRYERKLFHFSLHLQKEFNNSGFNWLLGLEHFNHKLSSFDFENYNEGLSDSEKLKDTTTLYELYNQWSFIPDKDFDGGIVNYVKAGLIYDTRDQEANPMKGVWSEVLFAGAPEFIGNKENNYLKMSVIHRHYFTLIPEDLNLALRFGYQGTILGKSPFYMQSYLLSSFTQSVNVEGLGGGKSLRGILRNRILGDDIFYSNIELRWKFFRTRFLKQNIYVAFSTFFDTGRVVDPIDLDKDKLPTSVNENNYFDASSDRFHSSIGAGLHVAMNQNFIVAVDYGKPLDKRDGLSGLYIGMNFLY